LHAIWPFLWIWATIYRPERGWGFSQQQQQDHSQLAALELRITQLEQQLQASSGTEHAKSAQQGEK
jgi:hypothetical protein